MNVSACCCVGETLDAARAIISEVPAGYISKIKREMEQQ